MDEGTKNFLLKAGLGAYIQVFADSEISSDQLSTLPTVAPLVLAELIPKAGHRIKYMEALSSDVNDGDSEISSRSASSTSNPANTSLVVDLAVNSYGETTVVSAHEFLANQIDFDRAIAQTHLLNQAKGTYIRSLAEKSIDGLIVLAAYQHKKQLEQALKFKLAKAIVLHELGLDANKDITPHRFRFLADCVGQEFNEDPELWYNPSRTSEGKTSLPSGKLYDQYTNICKELRKFGLRESRRGIKRPGEDSTICDGTDDLARLLPCTLNKEDVEERLQFLQTELNEWDTLTKYWKETVRYRQAKLRSETADESTYMYIYTYPVLKQPEGYKLLQSDFRQLFPHAYGRITTHWEPFVEKVKEQLAIENISVSARCSDAELLHLFARLVTTVPLKVPKGKAWKPSRKDVLDGFLCYSKTDDLLKHYDGIEERYRARGLTVQPFPMVIGDSLANIHTNYFVIDKTPVTLPTTRDLFATTFYAYHALYCRYPLQSARLWVIIEKALFGMEDVKDPQSQAVSKIPEVKRLIAALKV